MPEKEYLAPNEDSLRWDRMNPEDSRYQKIIEQNRTSSDRFLFRLHELNVIKSCDESIKQEGDSDSFYNSVKKSFLELSLLDLKRIATAHELADVGFENLIYEVSESDPK